MEEIAGWVAPAATMIAAMMTASNLGARFTGWGFVVFTVGSIGWVTIAVATDQGNLLWSNAFLTLVNLAGIYRWLGREARFGDAAEADLARSERRREGRLFRMSTLQGLAVRSSGGETIGHVVDAMSDCADGGIRHLVVRTGGALGVGETLRRLSFDQVGAIRDEALDAKVDRADALPEVEPE